VADRTAQTKYGWKDETIFDCTDGYAETAPAGRFRPNKFGLYDMLGNAWEWTEDCDHDSYRGAPADGSAWIDKACGSRVIRGGGFFNEPQDLRSARRFRDPPDDRYFYLGFRVARTLAP
jgi:formylglycine-generating enzyme required for sulfatase activity